MSNNDQILRDMLKKINDLEKEQQRMASLGSLYSIKNMSSTSNPPLLTANQNNYAPGDYDILQLTSNASRNITGFSGGIAGRVLYVVNIGNNPIVLVHASGLSLTVNTIYCPGGTNITMSAFGGAGAARAVQMYHSGTVWVVTFESVP